MLQCVRGEGGGEVCECVREEGEVCEGGGRCVIV